MSDPKDPRRDELADALHRLAGGNADDNEADSRSPSASLPGSPRRAARPPAEPAKSSSPPAIPPPAQRVRPAAPEGPDLDPVHRVEDDDIVNVPAPSREVFARTRAAKASAQRGSLLRSMFYRRTLIPILLTNGVMLPLLGVLWFTTETDSPFRRPGIWLPIALIGIGVMLLATGLLNALHIRHILAQERR